MLICALKEYQDQLCDGFFTPVILMMYIPDRPYDFLNIWRFSYLKIITGGFWLKFKKKSKEVGNGTGIN